MLRSISFAILLVCSCSAESVVGRYDHDGPRPVTQLTMQVTGGPNGPFSEVVFMPGGSGAHPVVILSSGFFQPAAGYAPYAQRLASWGVVTLLRDDPNLGEDTPSIVGDVSYLVSTWLALQNGGGQGPLAGKLDMAHIGLAGHSRGGQVSLLAAEGGAKGHVLGVFCLDPVDSATNGVEARTALGSIAVPVAFIGETADSQGAMACAPAADNYSVLYEAAASPVVSITATNADHTMFEDPGSCVACALCTAGTADQAKVEAYSVRYLTAFFARVLEGDSSVGPTFKGAGAAADTSAGLIQLVAK